MTLEQVQEIFKTQLALDPVDLYYLVINTTEVSAIRHRLDQQSLQDLAVALEGLEYEPSADSTPKFRKI